MTAVLLTCPDALLCNIGLRVGGDVDAAAHCLDGNVSRRGPHFAIELRDPVDAVLAMQRLHAEHPVELASFVASAAAREMLCEDREPIRSAWQWLCSLAPAAPHAQVGFVRHFSDVFVRPLPPAIAEQRLPPGGLVLWSVSDDRIVAFDADFTLGRGPDCALRFQTAYISRRHVRFERIADGWRVRDLGSTSGFGIDDRRGGESQLLMPGMVVQFARPLALVVLAVR